jgi:uncharacterized membrane protein
LDLAEYQRLRRQLDEELRAGIEMLQAGHRAKAVELDRLWTSAAAPVQPAAPALAPAPSAAPGEPVQRLEAGELLADVELALAEVGEVFRKSDLRAALGYEPQRSTLHRVLAELQRDGVIQVDHPGSGRRATRYRKIVQSP